MKIDVEKLAREAHLIRDGGVCLPAWPSSLADFARLVMEECAKVCDEDAEALTANLPRCVGDRRESVGGKIQEARELGESIRARMP